MESLLLPDANYHSEVEWDRRRPRRLKLSGKSYGLSVLLDPELDEYFCTTADSIGFQVNIYLTIN